MGTVTPLLRGDAFDLETIGFMQHAYDQACKELALAAGDGAATREELAKRIVDLAARGERDPERLRERALALFRI